MTIVDIDSINAAGLGGEGVQMAEALQVVTAIPRVVREAREEGGEQRGDRWLRCAEGEPPAAEEQETDCHADGHVEAVGDIRIDTPSQHAEEPEAPQVARPGHDEGESEGGGA